MGDKILVNVIITTYDRDGSRTPLAIATLEALFKYLQYPNLHYIIADNQSPRVQHMEEIVYRINERDIVPSYEIITTPNNLGVGGSKNNALRKAFETSPIVLLTEDDWILQYPLDIMPYVQLLLDREDIGIFRMGYLGGNFDAHYEDLISPFLSGWRLIQGSDINVYAGQISLRHKRFYNSIGYHAEKLQAGQEEEEMCWRYNKTENAPSIFWPAPWGCQFNTGPFLNIGTGDMSLNAKEPE